VQQVYEQRLAARLPGIRVINAGVPGDTTDRGRARFARDVLAHEPDLVVIQFGANDSAIDVWKGATKPRVGQERYTANLRFFIAELQKRHCQVILMTPGLFRWTDKLRGMYGKPPYRPDQPDGFCVTLKEYAAIVRRLAEEKGLPLVDVYAAQTQYDAKPDQSVDALFLDGMHPNDRGHELIADLLAPVLRHLLKLPPTR
jgi:lysophospholipase L1-like esterase